jgi:hypothetical protein
MPVRFGWQDVIDEFSPVEDEGQHAYNVLDLSTSI